MTWLREQAGDFYEAGIRKLVLSLRIMCIIGAVYTTILLKNEIDTIVSTSVSFCC
jgi:hypothetical protein